MSRIGPGLHWSTSKVGWLLCRQDLYRHQACAFHLGQHTTTCSFWSCKDLCERPPRRKGSIFSANRPWVAFHKQEARDRSHSCHLLHKSCIGPVLGGPGSCRHHRGSHQGWWRLQEREASGGCAALKTRRILCPGHDSAQKAFDANEPRSVFDTRSVFDRIVHDSSQVHTCKRRQPDLIAHLALQLDNV